MQTDTPHPAAAPTARRERRTIRAALRALDARWLLRPRDLEPGPELDRLLAPLLACAARVAEPGAAGHMLRVGRIAEATARTAGWDPLRAAELRVHGALHDLGKLAVGAAILGKAGPLSEDERRSVERHAAAGFWLLAGARAPLLRTAARVAREHHEWWDGHGYPRRLAGKEIHPSARVVAIADVYDALTSTRPYRGALPPETAVAIMREGRGTQFDPHLFDAFLEAWTLCTSHGPCLPAG
jgi:putative two-component system response regulator